ncbi:MAG: hypothetical protein KVP17_001020 [Porospora cf. gigantea B]|uniref:uncharacterized protein n=1 Tax=Porospora cf. gigantea B TaxID=2853592 RepID=UPI003571B04E|nr:MAG: hypothetical protein KVP17_001020 [Porospora cf. gigantea B]
MCLPNPMDDVCRASRKAAQKLASMPLSKRNQVLENFKVALVNQKTAILESNKIDIAVAHEEAAKGTISDSLVKRLDLSGSKFDCLITGLDQVIAMKDPLGQRTMHSEMSPGLVMERVTTPIGVLCIIYEARPEAAVQIASLAVKSGNALLLKGGKEASESNRAIYEALRSALKATPDVPEAAIQLVQTRHEISVLLKMDKYVDMVIPRGSNSLVTHIKNNTTIPVLGHADGICSTYVDAKADLDMAVKVVADAKTDYPAACNATETVLVHADIAENFLPKLVSALPQVKFHADERALPFTPNGVPATEGDFCAEYLALEIAVKTVGSVEEGVDHINEHGSGHTDSILTEDPAAADYFLSNIDSAGVYHNCSTRFADGFRYGFGAEVGISTNRLHARGPVGMEGLTIYKYKITGRGHTAGEFTRGEKEWTHRKLEL